MPTGALQGLVVLFPEQALVFLVNRPHGDVVGVQADGQQGIRMFPALFYGDPSF